MKELPILFSGEMVRAILAKRKTQTRRIVKPQPDVLVRYDGIDEDDGIHYWERMNGDEYTEEYIPLGACRYGRAGDRLWVRESLYLGGDNVWRYRADDSIVYCGADGIAWAHHKETGYCSSIHMPRWASRISLEVVNVRVERLQEISERDVVAEGVEVGCEYWYGNFQKLWNSINGIGAWGTNPLVWAIEFKVAEE